MASIEDLPDEELAVVHLANELRIERARQATRELGRDVARLLDETESLLGDIPVEPSDADLYETAFNADPNAQGAGRSALRAAFAATQSGTYTRAIQDYDRLLTTYGSESAFKQLQSNPVQYRERVEFVTTAYERKAALQQSGFAFADASATYRAMATTVRLDATARRNAAFTAMNLDAALSRRDLVVSMQRLTERYIRVFETESTGHEYLPL